jgi:hypothetical protein
MKILDIFQQIASTSDPSKELVTKKLLIFRCYQVDTKDIKCPLQWWRKYKTMFPTISLLACQILGFIRSQIETKRIFFLASVRTNLRRCCLQLETFEILIFVNKNWPSELRDGCKPPSNLTELIQTNLGFEDELGEFEGSFEQNEIVNI